MGVVGWGVGGMKMVRTHHPWAKKVRLNWKEQVRVTKCERIKKKTETNCFSSNIFVTTVSAVAIYLVFDCCVFSFSTIKKHEMQSKAIQVFLYNNI